MLTLCQQPIGKRITELQYPSGFRGSSDFVVGRVQFAVTDVFQNAGGEQDLTAERKGHNKWGESVRVWEGDNVWDAIGC